jgi:cell division protein FtsB
MHAAEPGSAAGAVHHSGSGSNSAFSALSLQTIQDQQDIIERQQELVTALKQRIEQLEAQSRSTSCAKTQHSGGAAAVYAAEVQLQRRVESAEAEKTQLKEQVTELTTQLALLVDQLRAERICSEKETAAWRAKVRAADEKAAAVAQLIDVMDQRTGRLTGQVDQLRREVEVRMYEAAQWRSLATMAVRHLDGAQGRYARDQIALIEDSVHRFSARQESLRGCCAARGAATSSCRSREEMEEKEMEENRPLWSRTAQPPESYLFNSALRGKANSTAAAQARFLTSMNAKTGSDASKRASTTAAATTQVERGATQERTCAASSQMTMPPRHPTVVRATTSPHSRRAEDRPAAGTSSTDYGQRNDAAARAASPPRPKSSIVQSSCALSSQVLPGSRAGSAAV